MNIEQRLAGAAFFDVKDDINMNAVDQGFVVVGHGVELAQNYLGKDLSINASFRSHQHELYAGRSGNSNHVWDKESFSIGTGYAVDISHMNLTKHDTHMLIAYLSGYAARICRYSSFLHVEFFRNEEETVHGTSKLYKFSGGRWKRVDSIDKMW